MAKNSSPCLVFISIEFVVPQANSLKAKRRVVKSILARLKNKFNASVAEIGYLDKWQRSLIGITMINTNRVMLEQQLVAIENQLRAVADIDLLAFNVEWL